MSPRTGPRPGGRSARVQRSVHAATRELLDEIGRDELTVPLIAARAGVTSSTIYRRWGGLRELLADVAVSRLRPETPPADTGSLRGDLQRWAREYVEEMASPDGRAFLRDVLAGSPDTHEAIRCAAFTRAHLDELLARAERRGEPAISSQTIVDHVVAPIVYRILFDDQPLSSSLADDLTGRLFGARQLSDGPERRPVSVSRAKGSVPSGP